MRFDPNNTVIKLCSEGIEAEGFGHPDKARVLYQRAWDISTNDFEKFTAAHYLARNQEDPATELNWNLKALQHADAVQLDTMKPYYPSLFLNIARSYENLGDISSAQKYYQSAADFIPYLPKDGYGTMIQSGINAALKRMQTLSQAS